MTEYEEIALTFPDGELVGPGQLQEWLDAVCAEPDLTEEQRDLAKAIVLRIRALSNLCELGESTRSCPGKG